MSPSSDKKSGSPIQRLQGDVVAGLVNGVASVPTSMATAAMDGDNPVYGLNAITVAPATRVPGESARVAVAAANDFLRRYRDDGEDTLKWPT